MDEAQADTIGGLNLYSDTPHAFDDADLRTGQLLATHGAVMASAAGDRARAEHLQQALLSNREIGVAMGILMARHTLTRDQAFDLLKAASQHTNRKPARRRHRGRRHRHPRAARSPGPRAPRRDGPPRARPALAARHPPPQPPHHAHSRQHAQHRRGRDDERRQRLVAEVGPAPADARRQAAPRRLAAQTEARRPTGRGGPAAAT
ncbi:hypothetical protein GCM10025868_01230 [Angustibacter aerolatus]|uniref:ANTAR domain-containing protein n=1 Tax=Angustibacter aerolatus TaxID=1162965 RepID=A0ABQ6JBN5_9ACTN|nr:ANTAR domain-containing protein [Angustibacter aerolatus]GMA84873.1 hypothetical protein GCM10025868_01230 [Angustibacter aerolatus]